MTRVILDKATLAKLRKLSQRAEVCDEDGHVLGVFSPIATDPGRARLDVPFTDEDLERFDKEPGGRSLAEILADLEKKG